MSTVVNPDSAMVCPICLDTMAVPIIQCQIGHSMCGSCIKISRIDKCPTCRGPLSNIRNFQLEQLIEGVKSVMKMNCFYSTKGCKYQLAHQDKESHEGECRFRRFHCEGKSFAKWKCNWTGEFADIHQHFKDCHKANSFMEYRTESAMKISFAQDFYDVHVISFFNGQQFFYYKHKVDVAKQKAYWLFQLIGTKIQAKHYYYEFEIFDGFRKFKVTEICDNDTANVNDIFAQEKCVVISFQSIKNFLNKKGELPFKFRLMTMKKPTGNSK